MRTFHGCQGFLVLCNRGSSSFGLTALRSNLSTAWLAIQWLSWHGTVVDGRLQLRILRIQGCHLRLFSRNLLHQQAQLLRLSKGKMDER